MLLAIILACTCLHIPPPPVQIQVACWDGGGAMGHAVPISPRHLLTAAHVVEACGEAPASIIAIWDGNVAEMMPLRRGKSDVAILEAASSPTLWDRWAAVGPGVGRPGDSGSPIYDAMGRIIGILSARIADEITFVPSSRWAGLIPRPVPPVKPGPSCP